PCIVFFFNCTTHNVLLIWAPLADLLYQKQFYLINQPVHLFLVFHIIISTYPPLGIYQDKCGAVDKLSFPGSILYGIYQKPFAGHFIYISGARRKEMPLLFLWLIARCILLQYIRCIICSIYRDRIQVDQCVVCKPFRHATHLIIHQVTK